MTSDTDIVKSISQNPVILEAVADASPLLALKNPEVILVYKHLLEKIQTLQLEMANLKKNVGLKFSAE